MKAPQLPHGGTERYTTRRVVFIQPFTLGKAPEVYPAGTYEVETKEEAVDRAGYTAHVRTGTMLIIPTSSGTRSCPVNGSELDDALQWDAESSGQADASENPDRGQGQLRATTDSHQ